VDWHGLAGTVKLMLPALKPGGLLLIGEPFWNETPPDEAYTSANISKDEFTTLSGTLDRIESAGLKLVEMGWRPLTLGIATSPPMVDSGRMVAEPSH